MGFELRERRGVSAIDRGSEFHPVGCHDPDNCRCFQCDCDLCGLGSQHLGNDLVGSAITAVVASGSRKKVDIASREDAMAWARTKRLPGTFPYTPSNACIEEA